MNGIDVSMHPETVAVLTDLKRTVEKSNATRATRAIRHKAENQALRQSISSLNPLTPTDGNRRKSSRAKPLTNKEKDNVAQQQEGITIHDDGTVDIVDVNASKQPTDGSILSQWSIIQQYLDSKFLNLERQNEEIHRQNAEILQQNNELKQGLVQSQQRVKELEIHVHQLQEQNSTGAPYLQAALRGSGATPKGPTIQPASSRGVILYDRL